MGCTEEAVLWARSGFDKKGIPKVTTPVEIMSRWEKGARQIMGPEDVPIGATGNVMVDREITVGSLLWLGELEDLPDAPSGLVEVIDYEEIPDVKGEEKQRNVVVRRWKDSLPTVA